MGKRKAESPTATQAFRQGLRIREAAERGIKGQFSVLSELVEHATNDVTKFERLQDNLPPDIEEALEAAQTALGGLATALEHHRPEITPQA